MINAGIQKGAQILMEKFFQVLGKAKRHAAAQVLRC